jgi:DnaK suppressor protein
MREDIDFEQFRKLLEAQKNFVQQLLEQESTSLRTFSDSNPDYIDEAAKTFDQERNIGWILLLKERQKQIEDALSRLNSGQFGTCAKCGKNIEIERLQLKPYASFCLNCKIRIENRNYYI